MRLLDSIGGASLLVDAVVAVLLILGARMWRRLPQEKPAVLAPGQLAST